MDARIWEETVMIPTYEVGEPTAHPMFFEHRVYQGSSGRVYPYPIIESVGDAKKDKTYRAVFLENEYLKVMVLPDLGGRIQRILNKTDNGEVVYYNEVIKPALVGLLGPWISGGIEFNWPQHHRPTTFMPVEYQLRENPDNSKSLLLSDIDRMYGTTAVTTITLYPDKAYVQVKGQLHNPTQFTQTFLWWANPAVAANEHTQSIFPPDVHAVMDHGKRDVSTFPIATGLYYKHDYGRGVDISRYRNIPVPTSYMAYHSDYDFVGSFDHQRQTGMLHVADHHISPGKKQWTWGCGDFGKAWDGNLTDANGPYIELMTGVFSDNQPDFSYLLPGEEKTFTQYFLPMTNTPCVCNATKDLVLSVERQEANLKMVTLYSAGVSGYMIVETDTGTGAELTHHRLAPTEYVRIPVSGQGQLCIAVKTAEGELLLSYAEKKQDKASPTPEPAKAIGEPDRIESLEELYFAAKHLDQYRHATFSSVPYYLEALKRDPGDARCNCGYGGLLLEKGLAEESEPYFRAAVERITRHNPNPEDTSAYMLLGLCLEQQSRDSEAYDAFYKAIWDGRQQEQGFGHLGMLEMKKGHWEAAIGFLEQALIRNSHNCRTLGMLALAERKRDNLARSRELVRELLAINPFDSFARRELKQLKGLSTYALLGLSADFAWLGLVQEATEVLVSCSDQSNPMVRLYHAYYTNQQYVDDCEDSTYFPSTLFDLKVLQAISPTSWRKQYLLGCYWYDKAEYRRAKQAWEMANRINPAHAKTLRCLSLVYFNQEQDQDRALKAMEKAVELDGKDDRLLFELDQLYKKCGKLPELRKKVLEKHLGLVFKRDDLTLEYVTLLNLLGSYGKAREIELSHSFHPWEGGEGKIAAQYMVTQVELAKEALKKNKTQEAGELLMQALSLPENLHEGKLDGNKDNEIHYFLGCVWEQAKNHGQAKLHWELATRGLLTASTAMFYYDQSPTLLFYKGLALKKLGKVDEAQACFDELLNYGSAHSEDRITIDYFAVSLPDLQVFTEDISRRNTINCLYLTGLGNLGKGNNQEAEDAFRRVLEMDPNHWEGRRFLMSSFS